jgi:ATP-dependent DNA helicase RecG
MDDHQANSLDRLLTPVQFLTGVGPRRAELLERLELRAVKDLLFFFPRDYREPPPQQAIDALQEQRPASVVGVVEEFELRNTGVGRCLLGVLIRQGHQYLRALWFNQPHMRDRFAVGLRVRLSGTPRLNGCRWEMTHPQVDVLNDDEDLPVDGILPVYGLTEGLRQFEMRRIVQTAVEGFADAVEETFPAAFLAAHDLDPIRTALQEIHRPADAVRLARAQRRFVYQELFVLQVALALRRQQRSGQCQAPALPLSAKIDARIRRLFPFELTPAQNGAIAEIAEDMGRPVPMNRLLQGDVGSGKTVVAEYALLLAVAHGHQAALMAPTEVLARQHVRTLNRDLRDSRVRIGLLTGSLTAAQRRETLAQIAAGELDLIVGTHALLQEQIEFAKLGLVVIDEQHKFGVQQRAALRRSGLDPHYLVMTATPIPRTVSMTWYGDLDVSALRECPPGRSLVHTYLGSAEQRAAWWDFFRKKLREGRQGYVIAPQIEADDSATAVATVQQSFEALANGELEEFRLALIHGQLGAAEKDLVMQAFQRGEIQVLVATSVVEVGVDVPNATLMTIEGGERFGLAQLHQLRGRISRGAIPGYLCVFAEPKTDDAQQRLQAFSQTTDGFQLAELDFQLRGPGDLFSARQHGLPPFRVADLTRDATVLEEARRDAQALVADRPALQAPDFARLRSLVTRRYGQVLELGDVG